MAKNKYGTVTCTIRELRSPVMERFRGWAFIAVRPNKARFNNRTGKYETSYADKYVVTRQYYLEPDEYWMIRFETRLRSLPFNIAVINWEL